MIYFFDTYALDTERRELRLGTSLVPVEPQVFDLLVYLVQNCERVVTKDDLITGIWRGRIVSESTLSTRINAARCAIGDSGKEQRLIRTLPRKGIRFVGAVREEERLAAATATTIEPPPAEAPAAVPDRPPRSERRQLTVVSCELLIEGGSTRMDPEELRDVVDAWRTCVVEIAGGFSGQVGRSFGKIVLVYFGYPAAHEDDAEQAVRAALELCDAGGSLELGRNIRLHARLGVATGPVVVGSLTSGEPDDRAPVGEAPSTASRLQSAARPDTILIDAATRRLIGSLFDCRDVDPINDPEITDSLPAWQVLGASLVESRFEALHPVALTPLVGREEEIELLVRRWTQAKSGEGRVVLISGEPGIGKSRIVAALQERLQPDRPTVLRYFCSPNSQGSVLRPITAHLERAAGFEATDTAERKFEKLETLLSGAYSPEHMAILADLLAIPAGERYPRLDLTPQRKRDRTFDELLRRVESLARQQPLLMIFEDLHWIDPTSLELLDRMVERVPHLPVFLVITSRPEIVASWIGLPQTTTLMLNRLARREGVALVAQIEGGAGLPKALVDQVVERSDGVPLFIEEMTKAMVESHGEGGNGIASAVPPATLAVPTTLQSSLMARLDRIGLGRQVAQIGAAIGRQFSFELINALSLLPNEDLRLGLQELVDAQLIFCRGTPPDAEYTFKHALVQDIAHESLLRSRRGQIHRQIAEAITVRFPAIAETQPELLARHLTEAGEKEAAIAAWQRAGEGALYRAAYVEATEHLGTAIALTDTLPEGPALRVLRLQLQIAHGNALIPSRGYGAPETTFAFARAAELAAGIEDATIRFPARYGLWVGSLVRGEPEPIRTLSAAFLRDAEREHDSPEVLIGHRIVGASRWYEGDYLGARTHLEQALGAFDPEQHRPLAFRYGQDVGVAGMIFLALTLWPLGEIARSHRLAEEAVAYAPTTGHLATVAYALTHSCLLELLCRDRAKLSLHGESLVAVSHELGLRFWFGYGAFALGYERWSAGEQDAGSTEMRRGMEMLREQGIAWCLPLLQSACAEAEAEMGRPESALAMLEDAFALGERTGQRWIESDLYRIRAHVLFHGAQPDLAAAEVALRRAIEIARSQHTRTFELRAALSLARLCHATKRNAEARTLLASVIEGFWPTNELPETEQAQALLAAL